MAVFVWKKGFNLKIVSAGGGECMRFAKEELSKYALRMLQDTDNEMRGEGCVALVCGKEKCAEYGVDVEQLRWDGYAVVAREGRLILASLLERGVLFAVYEFLKSNGCRFIKAARVNESIPQRDAFSFDGSVYRNPSFEIRSLATTVYEDTEVWKRETVDFVDWCAKNAINTVFLHQSVQTPLKNKNYEVQCEIARRGLRLEFGGHSAEQYIPRELFEKEPERFILKDGVRTAQGNFCVSNQKNYIDIKDNVLRYLRENSGIEVLHVWFEDSLSGSWCQCGQCKAMSPAAQQMHVVNYLARELKEEFPQMKFDMLLYHDALEKIEDIEQPEPNVVAVFAPRERCYAHALNDKSCALNTAMCGRLQDAIKKFGVENVCVFDYYMDYVLFSKIKTVLPHVIAKDLYYYHSLGLGQVCSLSFGLYSYWAYELNFYVYARHTFDACADIEQTIDDFCNDFKLGQSFKCYLSQMEQFCTQYFAFCGYLVNWYYDIRSLNLCDYFGEHIRKISSAINTLSQAEEELKRLAAGAKEHLADYYRYEAELLVITHMEAEGIFKRMSVRYENYRENPKDKTQLRERLESIKPVLYQMITMMEKVPEDVKGIQGGTTFREHLCKDQIWTINELLSKEFHLTVDLDRSII